MAKTVSGNETPPVEDLKSPVATLLNDSVLKAQKELSQLQAALKEKTEDENEYSKILSSEELKKRELIQALKEKREHFKKIENSLNQRLEDGSFSTAMQIKKAKTDLSLFMAAISDSDAQISELNKQTEVKRTNKKKTTIQKTKIMEGIEAVLQEAAKTQSKTKKEQEAKKVEENKTTTKTTAKTAQKAETAPKTDTAAKKPAAVKADTAAKKPAAAKAETTEKTTAAKTTAAKKPAAKPSEEKTDSVKNIAAEEKPVVKAAPKTKKEKGAKKPFVNPYKKKEDEGRYALKELYNESVVPSLMTQFKYKNINQVPKLEKIVINRGLGDVKDDAKKFAAAVEEIGLITGQKPIVTKAKKSIANFKVRANMNVGAKVTLRGDRMYEFLGKVISMALPRVRDFRGLNGNSFDGRGNYTFGLKEQLIFPEIKYDQIEKIRGFDIIIVTTAKTDEESKALLKAIGMPFGN